MHQSHNLPWHLLAQHLHLYTPKGVTPPAKQDLYPSGLPREGTDVEHFARKFAAMIREFAVTERKKYPSAETFDAPKTGQILPLEIFDRPKALLDETYEMWFPSVEKVCNVDTWIDRARVSDWNERLYYGNDD